MAKRGKKPVRFMGPTSVELVPYSILASAGVQGAVAGTVLDVAQSAREGDIIEAPSPVPEPHPETSLHLEGTRMC